MAEALSPDSPTPPSRTATARLWLRRLLPALLAFSPAVVLALLIDQNAVNIPVWDGWEKAIWLEKLKAGEYGLADLYAPHIEHRMVFPKIFILGLGLISDGDVRWEVAVTFLWTLAGAIALAALVHRLSPKKPSIWLHIFVANLVIFSPILFDNWLWGIQMAFMMPMACLCLSLLMCTLHTAWWKRWLAASTFALIGTHSFGHGMVVWPAVFGFVLLQPDFFNPRSDRWKFLGAWVALGAVVITCYFTVSFENVSQSFHAYGQAPGDTPPTFSEHNDLGADLERKTTFFLTVLGSPLVRITPWLPREISPSFGIPILLFFIVTSLRVLFGPKERRQAHIVWLALGGAAIAGALAITLARTEIVGSIRATSVRYASISSYLWVASFFLLGAWSRRPRTEAAGDSVAPSGGWIRPALWIIVGLSIPLWLRGAKAMTEYRHARLQEMAAVIFLDHFTPDFAHRIDASADFARRAAHIYDEHGWLERSMVQSLELKHFDPYDKPRPSNVAKIERVCDETEPGCVLFSGYARLSDRRPADLIFFTWENEEQEPLIFGIGEPTARLPALADSNDQELLGRLGDDPIAQWNWEKRLTRRSIEERLPERDGPVQIKTWMFDVIKMRAYRIDGTWELSPDNQISAVCERAEEALGAAPPRQPWQAPDPEI